MLRALTPSFSCGCRRIVSLPSVQGVRLRRTLCISGARSKSGAAVVDAASEEVAEGASTAIKAATASASADVTPLQLRRHALACAVPMVGFGFMDNLVMIQAGDLM